MPKSDVQSMINQIKDALAKYDYFRAKSGKDSCGDLGNVVISELETTLGATIARATPKDGPYALAVQEASKTGSQAISYYVGILRSLRDDYEKGYLQSVRELVHADMFSDFLDMATYLLEEGYKDPAAVMAGGVLEEHLRKLCEKNGIPITLPSDKGEHPKKADVLNVDLRKANVYGKLEQKNITAWLDLRNKAAHGKYSEYSADHVVLMIQGLRSFIVSNPA